MMSFNGIDIFIKDLYKYAYQFLLSYFFCIYNVFIDPLIHHQRFMMIEFTA